MKTKYKLSLESITYATRTKKEETIDEVLERYAWFRKYLKGVRLNVCNARDEKENN